MITTFIYKVNLPFIYCYVSTDENSVKNIWNFALSVFYIVFKINLDFKFLYS